MSVPGRMPNGCESIHLQTGMAAPPAFGPIASQCATACHPLSAYVRDPTQGMRLLALKLCRATGNQPRLCFADYLAIFCMKVERGMAQQHFHRISSQQVQPENLASCGILQSSCGP